MPPAPPEGSAAHGTNGDASDMLEMVRVFDSMRAVMAQAEQRLRKDRETNRRETTELQKERQSLTEEIAEQRRLLDEERRKFKAEVQHERDALAAQRKSLEAEKQVLPSQQPENGASSKPSAPMPHRGPPGTGAAEQARTSESAQAQESAPAASARTKAMPARVKQAPATRDLPAVELPQPKPKAMEPPQPKPKPKAAPNQAAPCRADVSTAASIADSASSSGRPGDRAADAPAASEIEDDILSDTPPVKFGEADEADRLALEDAAESTPKPTKAPPEPPIYWRHVKPPSEVKREAEAKAESGAQADEAAKAQAKAESAPNTEAAPQEEVASKAEAAKEGVATKAEVPVKSNPAYKAKENRYKPPPVMPPASTSGPSAAEVNDSEAAPTLDAPPSAAPQRPVPKVANPPGGVMKSPPTRCPPKSTPKAAPTPEQGDAPSAETTAPKAKVKQLPVGAKVKAPPGH